MLNRNPYLNNPTPQGHKTPPAHPGPPVQKARHPNPHHPRQGLHRKDLQPVFHNNRLQPRIPHPGQTALRNDQDRLRRTRRPTRLRQRPAQDQALHPPRNRPRRTPRPTGPHQRTPRKIRRHGRRHCPELDLLQRRILQVQRALPQPQTPTRAQNPAGQEERLQTPETPPAGLQERSRVRSEERKRQFNEHAIAHLNSVQPAAMAVEQKKVSNLMRSAKGKGRKRKAGLNRQLALAGLSILAQILARQCAKKGIITIPVPAPGSSQSCPNCGYRHRRNRESQAVFKCRKGDWKGNADHSAALIHRNRGFVRTTESIHGYTPYAEDVPTGWQEQPSRYSDQQEPAVAENAPKPKRNAASPRGNARRAGSGEQGPTSQVPGANGLPLTAGRPGKPGRRRRINTIGRAVEKR